VEIGCSAPDCRRRWPAESSIFGSYDRNGSWRWRGVGSRATLAPFNLAGAPADVKAFTRDLGLLFKKGGSPFSTMRWSGRKRYRHQGDCNPVVSQTAPPDTGGRKLWTEGLRVSIRRVPTIYVALVQVGETLRQKSIILLEADRDRKGASGSLRRKLNDRPAISDSSLLAARLFACLVFICCIALSSRRSQPIVGARQFRHKRTITNVGRCAATPTR